MIHLAAAGIMASVKERREIRFALRGSHCDT